MLHRQIISDQSLWDFACETYARQGVQSACLYLQEQHGWDIPLLLFCCWTGLRYGALSGMEIQAAKHFAENFSNQTVKPLRAIRATMKLGLNPNWPLSDGDWQQLREQVKIVELEAEKQLLEGLAAQFRAHAQTAGDINDVLVNIKRCFTLVESNSLRAHLAIVLDGVFQESKD